MNNDNHNESLININNDGNKNNKFRYNPKSLKSKTNPIVSPIRKKTKYVIQITNNINNNEKKENNYKEIYKEDEKTDKVNIIPIILPRIHSPTLKGNFNTRKTNQFDETNNFAGINVFNNKNLNRASLKAYK